MAVKTDFTPEEWKTLLESAMMAGIAVTAADPSGLWGTLKESMTSARMVMGAKRDADASELVKAIAADYETSEGRAAAREGLRSQLSGKRPAEITAKALEALKEAAAIVAAKAPAESAAYTGWLRQISQSVADASTEGGFLGFGGVKVSDAEKATLAQISSSLGLPA
ncbi:MAG: hypothetical protein L0Y57_10590 [Beijerinckiaceae bacterium]|nr:hypothetical protein [Beijerinckiaceae bacterium]